jgi:putative ABC transport system permease protein
MLGLMGGALGLVVSVWAIQALANGIPEGFSKFIPGWGRLGINLNVLGFTFVVSLLAGCAAGLAPMWYSMRTNLNDALKAGGRSDSGKGGHKRVRSVLVVAEVALSLVLLIGAGLMVRSFFELVHADLGIKPEHVLAMEISLPPDSYKDETKRLDFYQQLIGRVENLPGVMKTGATDIVPFSSSDNNNNFQIVGQPPFRKGEEPFVGVRVTTPGYFDAIGTALRQGRMFGPPDDMKAGAVILVNETFAKKFLPGQQPIGQRLQLGDGKETHEIIGVVADVKNDDFDEAVDPMSYMPYSQNPRRTMNLVIRGTNDPTQLVYVVRSEVRALDPTLPVSNAKTVRQMIDERMSPKRLMTYILGVFALSALLLASIGIYGVMSYAVAQRTQEIGIRMALGARAVDVLKLILKNGMALALIGVGIGLAGAFALTRLLENLLFQVKPTDKVTFVAVASALTVVALLACYIPARRATKVDPLVALRDE